MKEGLIAELRMTEEFFNRSTGCLTEDDATFSPQDGMLTVAQHIAHVADTVHWFIDGMINPEGFDMNFDSHWETVLGCQTLDEARKRVSQAIERATGVISEMSEEQLMSPLPEGIVMGGAPKLAVVGGISDHTAHHRGALTVYSRLLGKTPQMPYGDE